MEREKRKRDREVITELAKGPRDLGRRRIY